MDRPTILVLLLNFCIYVYFLGEKLSPGEDTQSASSDSIDALITGEHDLVY